MVQHNTTSVRVIMHYFAPVTTRHPVVIKQGCAALCFRWSAEAEAKEPDAPCRRINSVYTIHTILVGVPVLPDGYGSLSEIGFPQARKPLVACSYVKVCPCLLALALATLQRGAR